MERLFNVSWQLHFNTALRRVSSMIAHIRELSWTAAGEKNSAIPTTKRKTRLCRVTGGSPPEFVHQNVVQFAKSPFRVLTSSLTAGYYPRLLPFLWKQTLQTRIRDCASMVRRSLWRFRFRAEMPLTHRAGSPVWNWHPQKVGQVTTS